MQTGIYRGFDGGLFIQLMTAVCPLLIHLPPPPPPPPPPPKSDMQSPLQSQTQVSVCSCFNEALHSSPDNHSERGSRQHTGVCTCTNTAESWMELLAFHQRNLTSE